MGVNDHGDPRVYEAVRTAANPAPAGRRKILDDQTVATARIVSGPYLASLHRNEARTFTALEQRVKDNRSAPPQLRRIRIDTILVRTPDGWKVDWAQVI